MSFSNKAWCSATQPYYFSMRSSPENTEAEGSKL